jgi:alpha-mannosidase
MKKMIVHMIGNAHIDPVWLWRWQAGVDEALATFRSAADRCDEYPEFIYTRGEAWLYEQVEKLDPQLFRRVRKLVKRGQWHITGGQYVQPDGNLPTEIGLHRQIDRGSEYFKNRFDVTPRVGYNVDTFGHPAGLPDILVQHGYVGYVFHRPNAEQVKLPAQTIRWKGCGGGEVIGFRIAPAYVTRTDDLYGQIMLSVEAADRELGHTMCFYGVGNHGGGPTKANIEYILEHKNKFPDIELRFSTPEIFFNQVKAARKRLPVFEDELQHTFPGCYSVMHEVKQRQRRGEHLLDQSERILETFGLTSGDKVTQKKKLHSAWDDLLFTQFHDILAGTSIPSAWESVRSMQGRARIMGEEVILDTTRRWAREKLPPVNEQQIVAFNGSASPWKGMMEAEPFLDFDLWGNRWISDLKGQAIDFQEVQSETPTGVISRIIFPLEVPAQGTQQVLVLDGPQREDRKVATDLSVSKTHLANAHLKVELAGFGIRQISCKGKPLLGKGGIGLHLRNDATDTWTFRTDRWSERVNKVFKSKGWLVEETGPLRARLRLEGWLGNSEVRWTLSLHRDVPTLFLTLEINFSEKFKLLQLPIDLATKPQSWMSGLAGGQVERESSPVEWPIVDWSRVQVGNRNLAVVTPDAYSLSLQGKLWQWTLLRSPKMAWGGGKGQIDTGHDWHTDQGAHRFDFEIHADTLLEDDFLRTKSIQLAQPPVVFDRYEGMDRPPWKNNTPRRLWTGAEQRARQDGRMMHLVDAENETSLEEKPDARKKSRR